MNRLIARRHLLPAFSMLIGFVAASSLTAQSQTYSVIHRFAWADGANPVAGLIVAGGNLYGTTNQGGSNGTGTVFEINSAGEETVLYNFKGGVDGASPEGALVLAGGNLYGTTSAGGTSGAGTVFEVTLKSGTLCGVSASGGTSCEATTPGVETVLYSFTGNGDGKTPESALVADSNGNLYGTTNSGGANDLGTVFEVLRPTTANGAWSEKVLYSFGKGTDGTDPVAGVTFDAAGNLYGTTSSGGSSGNGTVFQLAPSQSGWTENILYNFELQGDGGVPYAGIVVSGGKLYGATTDGGDSGQDGGGTVFELTPSNGSWNFSVLYRIPGWGISGSYQNLLVSGGTIYATTHCDGTAGLGTVYALTSSGDTWTSTSLHDFSGGTDGTYSFSNLVLSEGVLYGTTKIGGNNDYGIVFKVALPDIPIASPLRGNARIAF
jgi:uncharacterized repeat protein (TIGR03803 family)